MDHEVSNAGEIRSIVTDAEQCLREGRMQEAQDIALPLIPYVSECKEMIESERHRIKLRLYTILMHIPQVQFCEPEQLDAMATTQRIFRAPEEYTLAERLQAHVLYVQAKPDTVRGQELNEWNALKTAQEVLDNTASNGELCALAHHLICSRSLCEEEKRQHMKEFFKIPFVERGASLTTMCCVKMWPIVHVMTDDMYIEQSLKEVQDSFLKARLSLKKMQSILCRLANCEKFSERLDWLEEYDGQMESLMAYILMMPEPKRLIVYAHCIFAYRFACFGEPDGGFSHVHLARALAEALGDPELIDIVQQTEDVVEDVLDDRDREDDEDEEDDEDDEDTGEEWKKGQGDWLMGED